LYLSDHTLGVAHKGCQTPPPAKTVKTRSLWSVVIYTIIITLFSTLAEPSRSLRAQYVSKNGILGLKVDPIPPIHGGVDLLGIITHFRHACSSFRAPGSCQHLGGGSCPSLDLLFCPSCALPGGDTQEPSPVKRHLQRSLPLSCVKTS
jgi:hypothetical protein